MIRPTLRVTRFSEIDWPGYILLSIGLAALILFMKQGDRFFWLENPTIVRAGMLASVIVLASLRRFCCARCPARPPRHAGKRRVFPRGTGRLQRANDSSDRAAHQGSARGAPHRVSRLCRSSAGGQGEHAFKFPRSDGRADRQC